MNSAPGNSFAKQHVLPRLALAYGAETAEALFAEISELVATAAKKRTRPAKSWLDSSDIMLITYGDSIRESGKPPLRSLHEFVKQHLGDTIGAIHLLPFYPYSSDDGFSVIDYEAVNPELGNWNDVRSMAADFDLMFDAVINHISQRSAWFQAYLAGVPRYADFFTEADPDADHSAVIRPRASPLLTKCTTATGDKHVWTTFSDDQIDLNYANPRVLVAIIELLLSYVDRGARYLRFDAIGFLWKKPGTSCMHLPETHAIVQVMRAALEAAAPGTVIVTETNVPHEDNVSYFGDGHNEAHMVYQFPLPPLTLRAFQTGNANHLSHWAGHLQPTTARTTFFNFLASHDGIGVRPVEGILGTTEIEDMVARVTANGGLVSYRDAGNGTQSPYELNVNYLDAVTRSGDSVELKTRKFLAAHAMLLALAGVPGIYLHSLLGSRNDLDGVRTTGRSRSINREKLARATLERDIAAVGSLRHRVFTGFQRLLALRSKQTCFHPNAEQKVLCLDKRLFALVRTRDAAQLLALVNVSSDTVAVTVPSNAAPLLRHGDLRDLLNGEPIDAHGGDLALRIEPFQARWITAARS